MFNFQKNFLLIALLLIVFQLKAQEVTPLLSKSITKLELITPGISWEWSVASTKTIRLKAGVFSVPLSTYLAIDRPHNELSSHLFIHFDLQYRHYYNLLKRLSKSRDTIKNSGNYLALKILILPPHVFIDREVDEAIWLGPIWGLQRQISKKLSLDLAGGVGYYLLLGGNSFLSPMITINLAYELNFK